MDAELVRFSRSVGFPAWAPDVLGLAVRLSDHGRPADLLLSTTGRGTIGRRLLAPRRHLSTGIYGPLLPYGTAQPFELRLLVAPAGRAWRPFGLLRIGDSASEVGDGDVRFDPVLNPLPGLEFPRWKRDLREPAYASARDRA